MEQNQQSKTYPLRDLSLASFLLASEIVTLIRVEKKHNIVIFHFSPADKAQTLASAYFSDRPPYIPARKLFGSRRDLQDLIFSNE